MASSISLPLATKGIIGDSLSLATKGMEAESPTNIFVTNLTAERGFEGPQIILKWNNPPTAFTSIRVVRKRHAFPLTLTDGKEIFNTSSEEFFVDTDLTGGEWFYYTLFVEFNGAFIADIDGKRSITKQLALETGFFQNRMYLDYLPSMYRIEDKKGETRALIETPIADPDTKETLFFDESGNIQKGQLQRFMKMIGMAFDEIQKLTESLQILTDVDETCSDFLEFLGDLFGVPFNPDLPIPRQRDEIKSAVQVYKIKGTIPGIILQAESITGQIIGIDEFGDNLFVFNQIESTFLDTDDPAVGLNFGLPTDVIDYWIDLGEDRVYNFDRIGLFIFIDENGLSDRTVAKLQRILDEFVPATIGVVIILLELPAVENILLDVGESGEDISVEWLVFNDLDFLFNDLLTVFAGPSGI